MLKKIFMMLIMASLVLTISTITIGTAHAESVNIEPESNHERSYDVLSNYYTQKDDETKISNPDKSVITGYKKVATDSGNTLYVDTRNNKLNIAVELKNGYIFYSDPNYYGYNISAYLTTGGLSEISSTLLVDGKYSSSIEKNQKPILTFDFESVTNGFKATLDFDKLGIVLPVYVYLQNGNLKVEVKDSEIEEKGYAKTVQSIKKNDDGTVARDENGKPIIQEVTTVYNFALSSFTFFQYFGCVGYNKNFDNQINGYDFIPDGSGALSRFQYERKFTTRLQKRIYGDDMGIKKYSTFNAHLSDDIRISLPIYGVVHGYNQYAFLAALNSGAGEAEVILEPFGYGNRTIQTTYFKFYTREQYTVQIATSELGSTTTLPVNRYGDDLEIEYTFLSGDDANYSGLAKTYRDNYLNLTNEVDEEAMPLGLNVLAQDYKKGLFGKKFIPMTSYSELYDVLEILKNEGVMNFSISYMGWNKGGYYNNNSYKPRISHNLGSTKSYNNHITYINSNGYNIESCVDILSTYNQSKRGVVKKTNLDIFKKYSDSSLFDEAYLLNPVDASRLVLKYNKQYAKYGYSSINLGYYSLNNFQYRYKSVNYSREIAISEAREELRKISEAYSISLTGANSYTFDYLSRFYNMETSATGYTYLTDSVPFISLVLSGHTELYSPEINFMADYDRLALRLVEYNIYPYFTITSEDSSKLRYTNSEYLYTSMFSLWEDDIVEFYSFVSKALNNTLGASIISHKAIESGVAKVSYSNGVIIYVNYNNTSVSLDGLTISPLSYEVKR